MTKIHSDGMIRAICRARWMGRLERLREGLATPRPAAILPDTPSGDELLATTEAHTEAKPGTDAD